MVLETAAMPYMDLEEFVGVYEQNNIPKNVSNIRPNYDVLLQSLTSLSQEMEKSSNQVQNTPTKQTTVNPDLTADLFTSMSDNEIANYFMPVQGIDYDQTIEEDDPIKKFKDENKQKNQATDEFNSFNVNMPNLNPLFKFNSSFKPTVIKNATDIRGKPAPIKEVVEFHDCERNDEIIEEDDDDDQNNHKSTIEQFIKNSKIVGQRKHAISPDDLDEPVRVIKKRKPRTYKYNPKPLQHKVCRAFVPDELKDREYWERRKRNNEAAKKSREERRKKELEIINSFEIMKNEYSQIKIENIRLKARNAVLEKQVAELQKQKSNK